MNKLIIFGLLALFLNSINGEYTCSDYLTVYGSANLEDLEGEDCAMLTPTGEGMTHCCLFEIADEIYCKEVSDDQYENMGRFVKYTEDEKTNRLNEIKEIVAFFICYFRIIILNIKTFVLYSSLY